jgi:peptide/nickel transport system substrate-binding protein
MHYDIHCVAGWSDWEAAIAIIQQSLADVGVAAVPAPLPYLVWADKLQKGRFDMGIWSSTRGPTPYQFYRGQMARGPGAADRRGGDRQVPPLRQRHGEPHPSA